MLERIETGRLILRTINESDIDAVLDYYIRNKEFLEPWMPKLGRDFFTYEFQLQRLSFEKEMWEKGIEYRFRIFKKEEPEKNIGNIAVSNIVRGVLQSGCLGYSVDEKENGKRYATEVIRKIIEISFGEIKLHRLEANVIPTNAGSIRGSGKIKFHKRRLFKTVLQNKR
ncbi:MAG: GNAT family N-acetyltransferase [bacterium]